MRLHLPRHPARLEAAHPILIEELLELVQAGRQQAVDAMVLMLEDLYERGRESRFFRMLKGLSICELKTMSRGGAKGGSRIYFWLNAQDEAMVVNCEVKEDERPSAHKLKVVLEVRNAYEEGVNVLKKPEED